MTTPISARDPLAFHTPARGGFDLAEWLAESPPAEVTALPTTTATLANGLKIIVHERPRVPVVSSWLWYRVGSRDEVPGKTGIAHFLEHLMFKGTERFPKGEVDRLTQVHGGENNAFTFTDYTAYFFNFPAANWQLALQIEADRMRHCIFDAAEFEAERTVILSEIREAWDAPWDKLSMIADAEFYGEGHPYAHAAFGVEADVAGLSVADVRDFYRRFYQPGNATLIVVGDVRAGDAIAAAESHFGAIPPGEPISRPYESSPPSIRTKRPYLALTGDVSVERFFVSYAAPTSADADAPAMRILSSLLTEGDSSRLWRAVIEESGTATDFGSTLATLPLGGEWSVWGECAPGTTHESALAVIDAVLAEIRENGPTEAEIRTAKHQMLAGYAFALDTASDIANLLGDAEMIVGDHTKSAEILRAMLAVTPADVRAVAAKWLDPAGRQIATLSPATDASGIETGSESGDDLADETGDGFGDESPVTTIDTAHFTLHLARLENGLQIILAEQPEIPLVAARLDFGATPLYQPADRAGLNQLLAEMLDEGTDHFTGDEIKTIADHFGMRLFTSADGISLRAMKPTAARGLALMAEIAMRPTFPAEALDKRRAEQLADLAANLDDSNWQARRAFVGLIYPPSHPYGQLRTEATLRAVTRGDLADFHHTFFRPNNAVLIVTGQMTLDELLPLAEECFGDWRPKEIPALHFPHMAEPTADCRAIVEMPEKAVCSVYLGHLGIRRGDADYVPLLVMDNILGMGAGFTDRISRDLRDERGLAYNVWASITAQARLDRGTFQATINTDPANVEPAIAGIREHMRTLQTELPSAEEVAAAKSYLVGSHVFSAEGMGAVVRLLTAIHIHHLGWDYLDRFVADVEAVDAEQIREAARAHLHPDRLAIAIAGPPAAREAAQEAATKRDFTR